MRVRGNSTERMVLGALFAALTAVCAQVIIPIGTAYLLRRMSGHWKVALQTLIGLLALYLIIYNGSLLVKYMTL